MSGAAKRVLVVLAMAAAALSGCRRPTARQARGEANSVPVAAPQAGAGWREATIGVLPEPLMGPWSSVCANGHYAMVEKTANGQRVWFDGEVGPEFDHICDASPLDIPASSNLAIGGDVLVYTARSGSDWHLVRWGGGKSRAWHWAGEPRISADGRHVAYEVEVDGSRHIAIDDDLGPAYDKVSPVGFSPDGRRFAYRAQRSGEWFVVLDHEELRESLGSDSRPGSPGGRDLGTTWPTFSPDSRGFAYAICRQGKWHVVVDGKLGPAHPGRSALGLNPWFTFDSRHVVFALETADRRPLVWVDDDPLGLPERGLGSRYVSITPDLRHVACGVAVPGGDAVALDGRRGPVFEDILPWPAFSPDGSRLAYMAREAGKCVVVVDGERQGESDERCGFSFSDDGRHFGFVRKQDDGWCLVVDGKPGPRYEGWDDPFNMGAYRNRESPGVEAPVFDASARHFAYVAHPEGQVQVLLDQAPLGAIYGSLVSGLRFREDNTLEFLGVRDRVLYRVTFDVPSGPGP